MEQKQKTKRELLEFAEEIEHKNSNIERIFAIISKLINELECINNNSKVTCVIEQIFALVEYGEKLTEEQKEGVEHILTGLLRLSN